MMKRAFGFAALALAVAGLPSLGLAQEAAAPVFVIDLASDEHRSTVVRASTLNDALANAKPSATAANPASDAKRLFVRTPGDGLIDSCRPAAEGAVPLTETPPIILALYNCFECLAAYQETRYTATRNDTVLLLVLYKSPITSSQLKPFFSEVPRDSELVATAKALREITARESGGIACQAFLYRLQRKRSFLKVSLPVPQRASNDPLVTGSREPEVLTSPEVTVGPTEHWFLSADFSISKASVALGKTPSPGAEELKTKDFSVALNFAVKDLLADRQAPLQRRGFLDELLFKVQATPSREPWEAWAVGVGIRGYRLKTILWNWDVVHPYVSVGRQKDAPGKKWRMVFGLGFDPRSINKQE